MEVITTQWAAFSAALDAFGSRNIPFLAEFLGVEVQAFTFLVALNNVSRFKRNQTAAGKTLCVMTCAGPENTRGYAFLLHYIFVFGVGVKCGPSPN